MRALGTVLVSPTSDEHLPTLPAVRNYFTVLAVLNKWVSGLAA